MGVNLDRVKLGLEVIKIISHLEEEISKAPEWVEKEDTSITEVTKRLKSLGFSPKLERLEEIPYQMNPDYELYSVYQPGYRDLPLQKSSNLGELHHLLSGFKSLLKMLSLVNGDSVTLSGIDKNLIEVIMSDEGDFPKFTFTQDYDKIVGGVVSSGGVYFDFINRLILVSVADTPEKVQSGKSDVEEAIQDFERSIDISDLKAMGILALIIVAVGSLALIA